MRTKKLEEEKPIKTEELTPIKKTRVKKVVKEEEEQRKPVEIPIELKYRLVMDFINYRGEMDDFNDYVSRNFGE